MIALVAAALVGGGTGGLTFGLPGAIIGSTVAVMLTGIILLTRE